MSGTCESTAARGLMEICRNDEELKQWLEQHLELKIPDKPVCPNHQAPFEYLHHAYFEPAADVVVWAPRGGGKTRLGAIATLLDLLHKPPCSVRILGGSLDQSRKMWEHLLPDVYKLAEAMLVDQRKVGHQIKLNNDSMAAVLTQSQRAVRGLRVQKLRCDEVELFDPHIWEAAQLVTRSISSERWSEPIRGVVEAISTHHKPYGLMSKILNRAREDGTKIIHWCLLDVLEKCPPERDCNTCPLWEDCRMVAKTKCNGFFRIDDAIAMKRRVSRDTWDSEIMCRRPSMLESVFPALNPEVHVRDNVAMVDDEVRMSLAIDFGFHAPFVCLWVREDGQTVHVVDEYVQPGRVISDHVEEIKARQWGFVVRLCCDPAGSGRNDQTAESNVQFLRRCGFKVHTRHSRINEGLEMLRAAIHPATGLPRLFVHSRCLRLIRAMQQYRYAPGGSELPLKDGEHDHLIDALRYFYVNQSTGKIGGRRY